MCDFQERGNQDGKRKVRTVEGTVTETEHGQKEFTPNETD